MDDLDLEQLKQELHDVSGGSVYDVDEIMREAGSDTPEGSENSLESLIKSLGVRVEEPQPMPQEQTELLKTKPILPSEQNSTQSVGKAAPVSADMMPEFDGNTDLSALFLAAEQTQALVDEQNAMADKSKDAEQQKTEEEANPFEEQDNVFAQLFAQLGEIEEDEKPAAPQMTEPVTELEEEPDLMARLFQPAEGIAEMFSESVIPEELGTKPFEGVLDSATRVIEWEDEPNAQPEESEPQTEKMDADTYDEDNEEAEESEQEKSDDITQAYEEEAEPEDEEDFEDEEEEVEEESEEIEERPKRGFFARLFGASEDDDEDFEENEDSEDDSAYDEEEVEESDEDAFDEEGDFEDEDEEDITDEPEYDGDFKDDSAYDEEESEENEESEGIEEQRKRGFFARLFGASEDDEELEEDDDFEDDSVYDEDEAEAEESEEDELEEEEDSDDAEDDQDESDGENTESDETAALTEQPEKAEPEDPDAASVFDALSEQETRRVVLQSEKEMIAEEADEPEEMDFIAEEESEDEIAEKTQASEELSKPGFLNKLMDVFGLEIVEEEIDEPEDTEETEPEEETELTEAAEPEEQREIEPEEESMESIKAVPSEEESEDIEEQLEENPELDRAEADFRDILQREEEIEAEEETLSVPRPRPEDTPVISEEELEEFLSDVDEEEETEKVSFEQLLRNNGIDVDAERKKPKLSLEEFPDEETTIYVDIPVRMPSDEEREDRKPQLFDAEAEQKQEELSADEPEAMEEAEQPITEPDQPEEFREASEKEPEAETEKQPESDLEWMNLPLEELYKIAPSMEVLRREGPVMAHEVLRQKEWIMARIRRYKDEQNGMMEQPEEAKEEPEQPKPQEASEPTEEADAIHAADELHALLEQDAEDDAVFPEGPTDKPETEPAGRQEIIVEVTARVRKPEQEISESEWEEPFGDQPEQDGKSSVQLEQDGKSSVQLEQDGKSSSQPEQQPVRRKKRPAKTVAKPTVRIPKNLNQESKNCRRQAGKQARRATVIAILTLVCIYISCAADFTLLPLPTAINYVYHPDHVLIVFLVLMGISILLAYDVVLDGIQALLQLQPNLSTLVDLALVLNIVHCVTRLVSEGEEIPYVCIVMLVLFAQLRAQVSRTTILHYTYKVAGNAGEPMGLFYHDGPKPHLVKTPLKNTDAFIAQTLKQGIRHRMESIFTILSVVTAVVLAAIVCVATGDLGRLVYVLAATVTGACQIALICAMVMARSYSARRMQRSGAAADDNLGVQLLAKAETIVLTDEDLFPASSIALERLELRSNLNDATALAYAASLTSGTSLGHMLAEEVRTRYGAPLAARHVVEDETGGISGQVGGIEVLLGTDQYMAEHGIIAREIPENGLILALDGDVAAVLVIDYQVPAVLFNAMQVLTERKIHIWLHTRNHQITPGVVEEKYALKAGTVTVPELEIDRALSDPKYTAYDRLCGLLARDGLIPMSGCITSAREEARVSKLGVIIGVCAALLCMLLMAYLCYVFVPADARPIRVLIYMILCFIPIFFLENGIGKE